MLVARETVVVGNKTDLAAERREIPTAHGRNWAIQHGMSFHEVSALRGYDTSSLILSTMVSDGESCWFFFGFFFCFFLFFLR
jgi:hypothetical protein